MVRFGDLSYFWAVVLLVITGSLAGSERARTRSACKYMYPGGSLHVIPSPVFLMPLRLERYLFYIRYRGLVQADLMCPGVHS